MTPSQQVITILLCVFATMISRFLPFIIFSDKKPTPSYIIYLGKFLPCAVFAMLVVYSLKNVSLFQGNHGIPEAISIFVTILLHHIKNQMMLSIAGGTITYMFLLQFIF